ncbi:NKAP family protein-like isoform X2 [Pectinophora gossypiella]|nr:NKAP family protein-like isoform X2 [Pectinophora gossypiella]
MSTRETDLSHLHSYIEGMDKEITMILQSLQWDQKHLLEGIPLVACKHDSTHKVPPDKKEDHEIDCLLRSQGYSKEDILLPEVIDSSVHTLVKLSKNDIDHLIHSAALSDPLFKTGSGSEHPPLTAERLQAAYSADERRVIHDAVVGAMPDSWHGEDILLPSEGGEGEGVRRRKSKLEVLAELRDMRRRRVRYRGATANRNYSHVIRDLIKTQMEVYTGVQGDDMPATSTAESNRHLPIDCEQQHNKDINKDNNISRERYRNNKDNYRGTKRNEKRTERSRSNERYRYDEQRRRTKITLKDRYSNVHDRDQRDNTSETFIKIESSEIEIKREIGEYTEYGDKSAKDKGHRDGYNNGDAKCKTNQYGAGGSGSTKRHREQNFTGDGYRNEKVHNSNKYENSDNSARRRYHRHRDDRTDSDSGVIRTIKIERHEDCGASRKHSEYNASNSGNEKGFENHKFNEKASSSSKRHHERRDYNNVGNERARTTNKYGESEGKRYREDSDRDIHSDSSRTTHSSYRHDYDHKRTHKSHKHKDSSDSSAMRQNGHSGDYRYERSHRTEKHDGSSSSKNVHRDRSKDRPKERYEYKHLR